MGKKNLRIAWQNFSITQQPDEFTSLGPFFLLIEGVRGLTRNQLLYLQKRRFHLIAQADLNPHATMTQPHKATSELVLQQDSRADDRSSWRGGGHKYLATGTLVQCICSLDPPLSEVEERKGQEAFSPLSCRQSADRILLHQVYL